MRRTILDLDEVFARNRARFGGWTWMAEDIEEEDDTDDDSDDKDESEDDDDSDDEDDDEKLKEPGKKALAKERERNKELRRRLREAEAKAAEKAGDQGEDTEKAREEEREKWKPKVISAAARAALTEAGGSDLKALLKLIEHDDLDVADDGTVDGLDDEVERLKDEHPALFSRRRGSKLETGDRGTGKKKPMTATERQAAGILRRD